MKTAKYLILLAVLAIPVGSIFANGGVVLQLEAPITGHADAIGGSGLLGINTMNGPGVTGYASNSGIGILGSSDNADGVRGYSIHGTGINGYTSAQDGIGIEAKNGAGGIALKVSGAIQSEYTPGNILKIYDKDTGELLGEFEFEIIMRE